VTSNVVSKQQTEDDKAFLRRAQELKQEGNTHFNHGRLEHARQAYSKGLQLCKGQSEEAAVLHSNLGAVLMLQHNLEEAVKEFTLALELDPYFIRARQRRARAYELLGNLIAALSDVRFLLKVLPKGHEAFVTLQTRLVDQIRKESRLKKEAETKKDTMEEGEMVSLKLVQGEDVRLVEVVDNINYAELRALALEKFPSISHFSVQFTDSEGDVVTLSCQDDVNVALRQARDKGNTAKMTIQEIEEKEVIQPPTEEMASVKITPELQLSDELEQGKGLNSDAKKDEADEIYELDDWMIDFAELFKEQLGIDPDTPLDLSKIAWDKCAEALDSSIQHEKAEDLLRQAANKFEDSILTALVNLGNVYMCLARKYVDSKTDDKEADCIEKADTELDAAERVYKEALSRKADFADAVLALGQLAFEKGKISMSTKLPDEHKYHSSKSEAFFESSIEFFKDSLGLLPAESEGEGEAEAKDNGSDTNASHDVGIRAQAQVMWGNALYELSQCFASDDSKQGKWKPLLEGALEKFKDAKCRGEEVSNALQMHCKSEEIDKDKLMEAFQQGAEDK